MKVVVALTLIAASSLATPIKSIEDINQDLKSSRDSRQAPGGYYGHPGYHGAAGISSGSAAGAAGAGYGNSVGVFPSAKVSGCNVPLLLSCSPNIVVGKIVHDYSAPSYKDVDEDLLVLRGADWMSKAREANHHSITTSHKEEQIDKKETV